MSNGFRTVSINVKSNPLMTQAHVRHDVREAAKQAGLIGWNEIGPNRYRQAIRNLGPGWNHYMPHDGGLQIPNPISWKNEIWKKEDAGFVRTHHGLHDVSPNRYITWVKLKHRDTGQEIVRINTHLVSGAFSGKHHHQWRVDHWNEHIADLKKLVKHFESKGLTVVIGGDFNKDSAKVLGNQVAYDNKRDVPTHGKSTLDYLMHSKHGNVRSAGVRIDRDYFSDHDAVVGRYKFRG